LCHKSTPVLPVLYARFDDRVRLPINEYLAGSGRDPLEEGTTNSMQEKSGFTFDSNPYATPHCIADADGGVIQSGMLTCPFCGVSFLLTWGRYLCSPSGKHRCPSCNGTGYLKCTTTYLFQLGLLMVPSIASIVCPFLLLPSSTACITAVSCFALCWSLGAVIDRRLDTTRPNLPYKSG
jgi:hypothetical protein